MGWSEEINVADEHFHECSSDPYWSENTLLGFTIPERNLCGFVYYYFRPNMIAHVRAEVVVDEPAQVALGDGESEQGVLTPVRVAAALVEVLVGDVDLLAPAHVLLSSISCSPEYAMSGCIVLLSV